MYFWNTKALAHDLKNNRVTETQFKNYYLGLTILIIASVFLSTLEKRESILVALFGAALEIALAVWAFNTCFNLNGGVMGRDFLNKFIALNFVLALKGSVLSFLPILLISVLLDSFGVSHHVTDWIMTALTTAIVAIVYWRVIAHMKAVNVSNSPTN